MFRQYTRGRCLFQWPTFLRIKIVSSLAYVHDTSCVFLHISFVWENLLNQHKSQRQPTRCNSNGLLIIPVSSTCFGRNNCPKPVELTGIINKPLLLRLVGCIIYINDARSSKYHMLNGTYCIHLYHQLMHIR